MKNAKQNTKQTERGITLIALVVTIIVLLILAGVSIQMIAGQSGILKNAQQAREETIKGQIRDDVRREIMEKMTGNLGDISSADLYEILNKYFDLENSGEGENIVVKEPDKYTEEETNPWEEEDFPESFPELHSREGNYSFKLGDLYNGTLSETKPTPQTPTVVTLTGGNLNEYQGKYVDIGLDIVGDTKTTDDWKIFYVGGADANDEQKDEAYRDSGEVNGRIFLIAADYVPSSKIPSSVLSAAGLTNKNGTYSVYWSSPTWKGFPTATIEGITNFSKFIKHTGYDLTAHMSNNNSRAVSQLLDTTIWNGIKTAAGKEYQDKIDFCIDFCIGGPTLEMWCAAWNASNPTEGGFTKVYANGSYDADGYNVGANESATTEYYYMNGKSSLSSTELGKLKSDYSTFFPHTEAVDSSKCYGYWLASPSANRSGNLLGVHYDGSVYYGSYIYNDYCVRPVVCLKSGVRLEENEGKTNGGTTVYDLVVSK